MSNGNEAYVKEVGLLTTETYCTFAVFALMTFEWTITFDREVSLVWGRKITGASVLFILNRYWPFIEWLGQTISTFPLSQHSCEVDGYLVIIGKCGPPFVWASFSVLRAYALSNRRWWVIPLAAMFYIPDIVINCYYSSTLVPQVFPPPFNCSLVSTSFTETKWIHVTIVDRVCLIAGDLVVLFITWYSTIGIKKAVAGIPVRMSLTNTLFENGTLYFVCLLILNVVNILANAIPNTSAVSEFQDPITSILVSRFLLNLRDTIGGPGEDTLGSTASSVDPTFVVRSRGHSTVLADFVDSMGTDLDHSVEFLRHRSDSLNSWDGSDFARADGSGHKLEDQSAIAMQTCDPIRATSAESVEKREEGQAVVASV